MHPTATLVAYLHLCHRKLWLHAHHIRMEHSSDLVAEGRWIHESSYADRRSRFREIDLGHAKIDFFDPHTRTVHETKKSDKNEKAHLAQLKYYLWLLEEKGVSDVKGLLEYPRLRKRQEVSLNDADRQDIQGWIREIQHIISQDTCPKRLPKKRCTSCSYRDFCWAEEA